MDLAVYSLTEASWRTCKDQSSAIRRQVFIVEQGVPESDEWDGLDDSAEHFLIYRNDSRKAVACARLLRLTSPVTASNSVKITRMAVLPSYRGLGLGRALLQAMLDKARGHNCSTVALDAQMQAQEFYAKEGFLAVGKPFMDAGIKHLKMIKHL